MGVKAKGILAGAVLTVLGLVLQRFAGPVEAAFPAASASRWILLLLLGLLFLVYFLAARFRAWQWLLQEETAVSGIAWVLVWMLVLGFVPGVLSYWPFVLVWGWMLLLFGLASIRDLVRFKPERIPSLLLHPGLFTAVLSATLGSAQLETLEMTVDTGSRQEMAFAGEDDPTVVEPGIAVELHAFHVAYHDNGMPKRYASDITVYTADGQSLSGTVEVNHPFAADGWRIYQYSYEPSPEGDGFSSIFLLVKDPWLPAVYAGILLMLLGALSLLFTRSYSVVRKRWGWLLPAGLLLLTALFVRGFTPLFSRSLMPALQSPWFVPHVVVYMFSYALLSVAFLVAVYLLVFRRGAMPEKAMQLTDSLVSAGFSFLTFGMLFGAIWAKAAWGHYWAWDPKETWAAVTWLAILLYLHFRKAEPGRWKGALWLLLFAYLCLLMCWQGVNYLPSVQGLSMHVYN